MVSVFDIAASLLARAGGRLGAVKLQKLCFYSFGWYAHLTGRALFGEAFYAMPKGPVVGELLSAHAGRTAVTTSMIACQMDEREEGGRLDPLDPFVEDVIASVWAAYGHLTDWRLVDITHTEDVWRTAWHRKPDGSKRADMIPDAIIGYFLGRDVRPGEKLDLPLSEFSYLSVDEVAELEGTASRPSVHFARAMAELQAAS